jgi:hypothetical protein
MMTFRRYMVAMVVGLVASISTASATPPYQPAAPSAGTWNSEVFAAASTNNGGFETGTFAGWTVVNQAGGSGDWFINSGTTAPLSGLTIPAPPQGNYDATTDQTGPGSHILYQDITLGAHAKHVLSLIYSVNNQAGPYFTPASLDYVAVGPNQQFRIDIMSPAAPVDSVAPGDVLLTLFQNQVGDPAVIPPTTLQRDISQFAGTTIRLRFAEVDNQLFFQAGVDAVQVRSSSAAPALSQVGLAISVVVLLLLGSLRSMGGRRSAMQYR